MKKLRAPGSGPGPPEVQGKMSLPSFVRLNKAEPAGEASVLYFGVFTGSQKEGKDLLSAGAFMHCVSLSPDHSPM